MPITFTETKSVCHLAYDATTGSTYRFADGNTWTVIDDESSWTTGFKAIVIRPTGGGSASDVTILSFAGTDSILDALVDIDQATGGLPGQYVQGLAMTRRCMRLYGNLYLAGHSLGGGIAAFCSVSTGLPASTINPAPLVGGITLRSLGANAHITNYIPSNGEIVSSSAGRNPGVDVRMPANGNFLTRHMVRNVGPDVALPRFVGASGSW